MMERDIRAVLDGLGLLVEDSKDAGNLQAMRNYAAVMALCARAELPVAVAPFTMRLVWHRTRDSDPAQQWLRERIVASVATEDGRAPAG